MECGFDANVTWHPETKVEGENFTFHETTWEWVFSNLSDKPIQFYLPKQRVELIHAARSIQFFDLPDPMMMEAAVTLKVGEKRVFTTSGGRFASLEGGHSWADADNGEYGFRVIVRVNDESQIFGAPIQVREGSKSK